MPEVMISTLTCCIDCSQFTASCDSMQLEKRVKMIRIKDIYIYIYVRAIQMLTSRLSLLNKALTNL